MQLDALPRKVSCKTPGEKITTACHLERGTNSISSAVDYAFTQCSSPKELHMILAVVKNADLLYYKQDKSTDAELTHIAKIKGKFCLVVQ